MIWSFANKGLKPFYLKGDDSKLQRQHVTKIRLILTDLHYFKIVLEDAHDVDYSRILVKSAGELRFISGPKEVNIDNVRVFWPLAKLTSNLYQKLSGQSKL